MFYDRMHLFRSKSSYKLKYYVGVSEEMAGIKDIEKVR